MISITESAKNKIAEVLSDEDNPNMRLRMYVQGGGCAGMSYGFTIDEIKNEDDFEVPAGDTPVLIDSISMQYVENATIDYIEDLQGSRFSITNPQAQTTCGCGSSFNPY
jgi:iron-sulfur cluster insertion protein